MFDDIKSRIFSFSGLSICIAVIGFLSSIVQLFIDVNTTISIKWILFLLVLSISIIVILLKIIYDVSSENKADQSYAIPMKYIKDDDIFVIRKNSNFVGNIMVGCYVIIDEVEKLMSIGMIYHIQEKIIQIKVVQIMPMNGSISLAPEHLGCIIIRPVIPTSALETLIARRTENE